MIKLLLTIFPTLLLVYAYSQNDFLVFKKRHTTIDRFYKDSYISFQLRDGEWVKGKIAKIVKDSFYLTKEIIIYGMRNDTLHYGGFRYSLKDIYAMPKPGVFIDYINGSFQISMSGGHQHFYWIKSGWIFRYGAMGYAALNIFNSLTQNDFSLAKEKTPLGIAAAVFLFGEILHRTYKLTYRLGRKYYFEYVKVDS